MKKLKAMMLMAALAVGGTMWAAEDTLFLVFSHPDGTSTQVEIPFPDEETVGASQCPVMKFTETSIEITIPSETPGEAPAIHSIGVEDVLNASFSEKSSIVSAVADGNAVFTPVGGNSIRVTAPDRIGADEVRVYDLAGKTLSCPVAAEGVSATVSLAELPAGVYIVVYKNNSIKVTKK